MPETTQGAQAEPTTSRRQRVALLLASSVVLVPFVIGRFVEIALKAVNPDDVDVTAGLAYLRPLVLTGIALFVAMLALTITVTVRLQRVEGAGAARAAWLVLATQVALCVVLLVQNGVIDAIHAAWRSANGG